MFAPVITLSHYCGPPLCAVHDVIVSNQKTPWHRQSATDLY